ncbi:MAG: NHLP leader peptide family RiPP precursor [Chroococcidiopsidaceae cyanobacterium CP_BM_ER_R8_30]|nr:NHLP leader peptide family RiPP precursor [Chroococcidiopsidaceae cyanobacterium CP_BM_ER_R8_30]
MTRITDVESQLIQQAAQDPAFRERLLSNPKAVLNEKGLAIPDSVQIQVLQETPNQFYLVLPLEQSAPASGTNVLADQELERVSGGAGTGQTGWTGCASGQSGCAYTGLPPCGMG